jgi:ubiquinone/menaquinone biosynthesis C-methylase UbiE
LHHRHGDDPGHDRQVRAKTLIYADRLLDAAGINEGTTLLDVGSGEGLVAFRALERFGPSLSVILCDSSGSILNHAQMLAYQAGCHRQCHFVQATAEDLSPIGSESVDVITARSVLAYVGDKPAAFREFHRILRPGGRISIAEPVMRDEALTVVAMRTLLDRRSADNREVLLPLLHRWKAAQYPDSLSALESNPTTNYTERDLVRFVQRQGFTDIDLTLHMHVGSTKPLPWQTFLHVAPYPGAPCLDTILREQFTLEEQLTFEQLLRPRIESGGRATTERMAYLTAQKPGHTWTGQSNGQAFQVSTETLALPGT